MPILSENEFNSMEWRHLPPIELAGTITGCRVYGVELSGGPYVGGRIVMCDGVVLYLEREDGSRLALDISDSEMALADGPDYIDMCVAELPADARGDPRNKTQ